MMPKKYITRRRILEYSATTIASSTLPLPALGKGHHKNVLIIGGGFGGATAAKYLRLIDPTIAVTLIDRDQSYTTCPFSNSVIGGWRKIGDLTHNRSGLKSYGVHLIQDDVLAIDIAKRQVHLRSGNKKSFDRMIIAPGIDLRHDLVPGYHPQMAKYLPHAWKAGAQTLLLRQQLEAMPDGGVVIIAVPDNPYRCPPGPYERASTIAYYLKTHKPRSKIIILDAKESFSKQALFQAAWEQLYPNMIEWISGSTGGKISHIDSTALTLHTDFGPQKGTVVNLIPPQSAPKLLRHANLSDEKGWCPVDVKSFESTKASNIHIIGDAIYAGAMPKSATSANAQAKIAAQAIVDLFNERPVRDPFLSNTCYSLVAPDYGISVTGLYQHVAGQLREIPNAGGVSPLQVSSIVRQQEATYAESWYAGIVTDSFK